jgi:hypothetical protein
MYQFEKIGSLMRHSQLQNTLLYISKDAIKDSVLQNWERVEMKNLKKRFIKFTVLKLIEETKKAQRNTGSKSNLQLKVILFSMYNSILNV